MKQKPRLPFHFLCLLILLQGQAIKVFAQNAQHSLFWKISGKGLSKPSYLFGTVHLYDTMAYRLPAPVFDSLKHVDKVFFEFDFGHLDMKKMMGAIFINDSTKYLNRLLDQKSQVKLKTIISASPTLHAMGPAVYRLKPFYLLAFLMAGPKTVSLDMELYKAAIACKDSVGGLETLDEQLAAIDGITLPTQVKLLTDALSSFKSSEQLLQKTTRIYVLQDEDHMIDSLEKEMPGDENFNKQLITGRNLIMAERISKLLGSKSILIAVGAGHLGTKDGLVALLRKRGFKLSPVVFQFQKK